jgi:hypothetical protein
VKGLAGIGLASAKLVKVKLLALLSTKVEF